MGEYTPKYGLYKPAIGEVNWGDDLNKNFDIIEEVVSAVEAKARSKLSELDDVDVTNVQHGHVLQYNADLGKRIPATIEAGGFKKVGEFIADADLDEASITGLDIPANVPCMFIAFIKNPTGSTGDIGIGVNTIGLWGAVMHDGATYTNESRVIKAVPASGFAMVMAMIIADENGRVYFTGHYGSYDPSVPERHTGVFGGVSGTITLPISKIELYAQYAGMIGTGSVLKVYALE